MNTCVARSEPGKFVARNTGVIGNHFPNYYGGLLRTLRCTHSKIGEERPRIVDQWRWQCFQVLSLLKIIHNNTCSDLDLWQSSDEADSSSINFTWRLEYDLKFGVTCSHFKFAHAPSIMQLIPAGSILSTQPIYVWMSNQVQCLVANGTIVILFYGTIGWKLNKV